MRVPGQPDSLHEGHDARYPLLCAWYPGMKGLPVFKGNGSGDAEMHVTDQLVLECAERSSEVRRVQTIV